MPDYTYLENVPGLLPDVPEDSILSRTVHRGDDVKVVLFRFAAGQELSEHTASQPALLIFVEGDAAVTLGGDEVRAQAGTLIHMPARLEHSVVAQSPVTMILLLLKGD